MKLGKSFAPKWQSSAYEGTPIPLSTERTTGVGMKTTAVTTREGDEGRDKVIEG